MPQAAGDIHTDETVIDRAWPSLARAVSFVGNAYAVEGAVDFDLDDLNLGRHQFPGRHVTLDGDVITVWPTSPARRKGGLLITHSGPTRSVRPDEQVGS